MGNCFGKIDEEEKQPILKSNSEHLHEGGKPPNFKQTPLKKQTYTVEYMFKK
jgi:hypothetical protein